LPQPIYGSTVVPYEDSFLLVGGYNGNAEGERKLNTIYKYDVANDSWRLLTPHLAEVKYHVTAVMVDRAMFPDCK
jgi:N-acetylneuraminic acid mutarotase